VGKNLPTRRDEAVDVHADGVDLGDLVPVDDRRRRQR
jgi:pyrimidine operon attenuation protein/uracil phosphoribosyltransferase